MRVGANIKTVLAALAQAIGKEGDDIKVAVSLIQKTHDICPNLEKIIGALVAGGLEQMEKECGIQLLTPIAPMLAHPVHSLDQVEKVMNETRNSAVMEWKYDGVRCQAHYDGSAIKLFSRHMLETTAQYPDAAKSLLDAIQGRNVHSFILDAEIVGVEGEGDKTRLLPFQDLSRRKRKNDDGQGVRVKVFAFDVMYLNGESFVDKPLWERQQALFDGFEETKDFAYVSSQKLASYNEPQLREYLQAAFQAGAEGLMLKMLGRCENDKRDEKDQALSDPKLGSPTGTSPYEAGTRSHSWLKVKRDYVDGYADTIDVVPIGAW
jgi:DNA ligase-1